MPCCEAVSLPLRGLKSCLGGIVHRRVGLEGFVLGRVFFHGCLVYNAHERPFLFHLVYKLVGIKTDTLDRPKDNSLGAFPGIHAEIHLAFQNLGSNSHRFRFQNLQHFTYCQIQLQHFSIAFTAISRSSK